MRILTDEDRIALREVGEPGEGPVGPDTFAYCIRQGWGYWGTDGRWHVTDTGRAALVLDDIARRMAACRRLGF